MTQYLSSEELAFRDGVRAFIQGNLPVELAQKARRQSRLVMVDMAFGNADHHQARFARLAFAPQ